MKKISYRDTLKANNRDKNEHLEKNQSQEKRWKKDPVGGCNLCDFSLAEHLLNHMELVFCGNMFTTEVSLLQIAPENFTLGHLTIRIMVFQAKLIFSFFLNWMYLSNFSACFSCGILCYFIIHFLRRRKIFITLDSLFASSPRTHQPTSPTHPYLWKTMNY